MHRANPAEICCQGKEGFTATQARQIATDMRRRGSKKFQLHAYHCGHCSKWHVGSRIATLPDARKEAKRARDVEENDDRSGEYGNEA